MVYLEAPAYNTFLSILLKSRGPKTEWKGNLFTFFSRQGKVWQLIITHWRLKKIKGKLMQAIL